MSRKQNKTKYPNSNTRWTREEETSLLVSVADNLKTEPDVEKVIKKIHNGFGRTYGSVIQKYNALTEKQKSPIKITRLKRVVNENNPNTIMFNLLTLKQKDELLRTLLNI